MALESILGRLNVAVMLLDERGSVTFANEPCQKAFGTAPETFFAAFPTACWSDLLARLGHGAQHLPLTDAAGASFDATLSLVEHDPVVVLAELAPANELSWPGEQALRRAQRRLELSQVASRTAFFEYLPGSDHFVTSTVGAALVGIDNTHFHADDIISRVPGNYAKELVHNFNAAVGERGTFETEIPITWPDTSETRWLMVRGEMRDDLEAGIWSMLGTIHDITDYKRTSLELNASRGLLTEAESLLQGFSFAWDLVANQWEVSPNFFGLMGIAYQMPSRRLIEGFIVPGDRALVEDEIRLALKERREFSIEHRVRLASEETRMFQLVGKPVLDDNGVPVRLVGASRDITELKETQRALRESEAKFRAFMEAFPGYVFIKDADHVYRFASASKGFRADSVQDVNTFEVKSTRDLYLPERAQEIEAHDDELLASGQPSEIVWTTDHPDGGTRYLEGSKFPISIGDETLIGGFVIDETARHRADEEKERMTSAIEHSGEMIVITDVDAIIEYVNPVFEEIMGYTKDEVIGGHNRMWRSGLHDQEFYDLAWEQIQRGETWKGTLINKRKDGSLIHEETTISQVRDRDGNVTGYVEVKRDVTRQKELEQRLTQSQKMESIGTLAGGVAHDYNNVLQTILGNAELLQEQLADRPDLFELADEVRRAAEHSASLTSQLLAFARKQVIQPRAVNLNIKLGGMLNMLRRLIGANIELSFEPAADLWNVRVDPSQIQQVITNIVVNSRDAIEGIGKVTVRTSNVSGAEACRDLPIVEPNHMDYVQIDIMDTGRGMSKDELARAFEPFFTTKPMDQGTGLGLATVYGVVKQNGGYVLCDSDENVGTTLSVLLPRYHGEVEESSMQVSDDESRTPGSKILVVEDDGAILRLIQRALGKAGYDVHPAESPDRALELATGDVRFDLVLTDIVMPTRNGLDLVAEIREHQPGIQTLFMSGYSADILDEVDDVDRERSFIQKPFNKTELVDRVAGILRDA